MAVMTPDRFLRAMRKTPAILQVILGGVSQGQAEVARDGAEGWSVLEIMCHIRDFEDIFFGRARQIVDEDMPQFAHINQNEMVTERDYAHANLSDAFDTYLATRRAFVAYLSGLPGATWERRGIHAEFGEMTLIELAMNVAIHDVNHAEQLIRALGLAETLVD